MASPSDYIASTISLSGPAAVSVQNFGVPVVVSYHTKFLPRVQFYQAATVLAALVTAGFATFSPTYLAVSEIVQQPNAPAVIGVGRRISMPLQTETITVTDALVGDVLALTVVGSDGVSHAVSLTMAANPGAALAGSATVSATQNSTAITFSSAQTLSKGAALVIAGVTYFLSAAVTASTAGTLTTAYAAATAAGLVTTTTAPLAGTFTTTRGSAAVPSTSSQVGAISVGDSIQFASQPGVYYQVFSVTASTVTLTANYTGAGSGTDNACDLSTLAYQAGQLQTLLNAFTNIGTPTVSTNVVTVSRTDGNLNGYSNWTASTQYAALQLADTTVDPGIASDLAAIQSFNNQGWYAYCLDSNSQSEIQAAAAWTRGTGTGGKFGFFNNSDYACQTTATTDVFTVLKGLTDAKNFVIYDNNNTLGYGGAATMGYALGQTPGSYALGYKSLTGVAVDLDTSLSESAALAINSMTAAAPGSGGKNGNYYRQVAGLNVVWPGVCPNGEFTDIAIFVDYFTVTVQADVLAYIAGAPGKVPYTDPGIGGVRDVIKRRAVIASKPPYNAIDPARLNTAPYGVNVPLAANSLATDRSNRNLAGVTYQFGLQGAILTTTLTGTLVQ